MKNLVLDSISVFFSRQMAQTTGYEIITLYIFSQACVVIRKII